MNWQLLAKEQPGILSCRKPSLQGARAFLRKWALTPEQCRYWYLNVIWKFRGHLRPFSFLTPGDLILTLTKLNLWPAISFWIWPFHSAFITSNTEKAVFSFTISSGNVLAVTPSWLYTCGLISTRSKSADNDWVSERVLGLCKTSWRFGGLCLVRDMATVTSASCNTIPASMGRTMSILWPAGFGTDFLTVFLKCHLFQYEEEYKFRN